MGMIDTTNSEGRKVYELRETYLNLPADADDDALDAAYLAWDLAATRLGAIITAAGVKYGEYDHYTADALAEPQR